MATLLRIVQHAVPIVLCVLACWLWIVAASRRRQVRYLEKCLRENSEYIGRMQCRVASLGIHFAGRDGAAHVFRDVTPGWYWSSEEYGVDATPMRTCDVLANRYEAAHDGRVQCVDEVHDGQDQQKQPATAGA